MEVKARGSSGDFVDQPDVLGAPISIPKARRSEAEFFTEMLQQLKAETGYDVRLGTVMTRLEMGTAEFGAENMSARDWSSALFGGAMVWQMLYDPENGGRYFLSLGWVPWPPQPLNPFPKPANRDPARRPGLNPPVLAFRNLSPQGRINIQSKLAQADYYQGELNGKWNQETTEALKEVPNGKQYPRHRLSRFGNNANARTEPSHPSTALTTLPRMVGQCDVPGLKTEKYSIQRHPVDWFCLVLLGFEQITMTLL